MVKRTGLFVIEGPDAVGKATQARMLADHLGAGDPVAFPRYNGPVGPTIKKLLRREFVLAAKVSIDSRDELVELGAAEQALALQVFMTFDRYLCWHLLRGLAETQPVVLDRGWPSALVYGGSDGIDVEILLEAHRSLAPADFAILLVLPAEEQQSRQVSRGRESDQYEEQALEIKRARQRAYEDLWDRLPGIVPQTRCLKVDARGTPAEVHARVLRACGLA